VEHVDNTTGPDTSHLGAVESTNLGELAGTGSVATVLGEEDRDVVVLELLGADVEARLLEGRVTAPRVDVVTPEVDGLLALSTVEEAGEVLTNVSIVVGSISNTDGTVVLGLDVSLGVADCSLDESAGQRVVRLVGHLVTGKETESVVVLHQLIDDVGVTGEEGSGPLRLLTVDRVARLGQVSNDVDASISESVHAVLVVLLGVDGIDTNCVGLELLEVLDVALAGGAVGKGVGDVKTLGVGGCGVAVYFLLIGDTLHEELLAAVLVEELGPLRWCK
jgi:hypothetical protein